ncbi:MAG TPA: glycosyl hydrolase, partial [Gemmatimonadaceae bacterium]|nr:glycosyl hydrolase [Gemmatimonadaceae bacterium]
MSPSRLAFVALLLTSPLFAQDAPLPQPRPVGAIRYAGQLDTALLSAMKWREIGPFRGGRSVAVAGSTQRPWEYYMGTTGGGVFKTTDGGNSWVPATDKFFGGTIGAIAVAPSNPDIVYVGGGEFPIRGNVSHGDGVWRSDDAGKTWRYLGLKETQQISRVRVDPRNPNVVWVAAQGKVWVADSARGVYKSKDGGKTWKKVLFRNDSTGAADLTIDPANPDIMYAGLWQAGRKPWQLISGGRGSGIFKSIDAGERWFEITRNPGLPNGLIGNIGISASAARKNRVYAIIEADSGGVFKSDDQGATWTRTNDERKLRQRAWYYTKIHADPQDSNTVWVNNVSFHKSTDGGKTFRAVRAPHGDSHDFWIAPNDNKRMIEGNDGGANVSFNGAQSWSDQDYATAQFYHVTTTNHFPYQVCGAQQDNSTLCGPSRNPGGIDIGDWKDAGGGESGYIAARPDNPDIVYAGSYGGFLTRKDMATGIERDINPWPDNPMGHSAVDLKYRFQWTFPIVVSPHDPNTIYAAANVLFRSTNEGQTWKAISPDLTRNDPSTLGASGGPITRDQTSVEYYGTVFTVAESPRLRGVIWTGSDDGLVQLTRDAGVTWKNVTPRDMAQWTRVSVVEASPHAAGTAYVAANRYQLGDFRPYIWKTTDFGQSWTRADAGIAADEFVRVVREDPERKGMLYAGTERGVWFSRDDGASWQKLQLNLPPVPVHDLAVKEGDLVAGTHGRSFWILDDLSVLRQADASIAGKAAHLYEPRDVWRVSWGGAPGGGGGAGGGNVTRPRGANPQSGAVVWYNLREGGKEVVLDFMDARGNVIRSFTSRQDSLVAADSLRADARRRAQIDSIRSAGGDTTKALERRGEETSPDEGPRRAPPPPRVANKKGLNSFVWNLRYPEASSFDDMIMWAGGTQGPVALPGVYQVRLSVDGQRVATDSFRVRKDPRTKATPADLREQFALLLKIRDRVSEANDAVKQIRSVKQQLEDREQRAASMGAGGANAVVLVRAVREVVSMVEDSIYQTKNRSNQDPLNYPIRLNNRIAALSGVVGGT